MSNPDDSGCAEITIEVPRARERLRSIRVPGEEPRLTSHDVVRVLGIETGDRIGLDRLLSALAEAEPRVALERATRLLGHRDRSCHEIATRLEADGYPAAVIEEVVDRLAGWGYLDDSRFAEAFVRTKAAASWGRLRIARALADAGVEDEIATPALDTLLPCDGELERAVCLVRLRTQDQAGYRRELARLVRKGFTYEIARSALEHAKKHQEQHPDPQ